MEWMELASKNGSTSASFLAGCMHLFGQGVPQNKIKVTFFFAIPLVINVKLAQC